MVGKAGNVAVEEKGGKREERVVKRGKEEEEKERVEERKGRKDAEREEVERRRESSGRKGALKKCFFVLLLPFSPELIL